MVIKGCETLPDFKCLKKREKEMVFDFRSVGHHSPAPNTGKRGVTTYMFTSGAPINGPMIKIG